jgi:hypothetical protein
MPVAAVVPVIMDSVQQVQVPVPAEIPAPFPLQHQDRQIQAAAAGACISPVHLVPADLVS